MSEVQEMLRHYAEVRNRLRRPPNAVPDTEINLRRSKSPPPPTEPPPQPEHKPQLTPAQQSRLETYQDSFCRKDLTFKNILKFAAAEFGIEYRLILTRSRNAKIVLPRQVSFYLANKHINQSLASMGRHMGLDHTSVIHGRDKIKRMMANDSSFNDRIKAMEVRLFESYTGLTLSAVNQCLVAVESGPGSQVGEIFPVDNAGWTASDDPKEGSDQDVAGEVHLPTTAIREAPQEEQ